MDVGGSFNPAIFAAAGGGATKADMKDLTSNSGLGCWAIIVGTFLVGFGLLVTLLEAGNTALYCIFAGVVIICGGCYKCMKADRETFDVADGARSGQHYREGSEECTCSANCNVHRQKSFRIPLPGEGSSTESSIAGPTLLDACIPPAKPLRNEPPPAYEDTVPAYGSIHASY